MAFQTVEEPQEFGVDPFEITLDWPDDMEGQGCIIKTLADIVDTPLLPIDMRSRAFDELRRIAREYREKGRAGTVPPEMSAFAFGAFSGGVERPKRGKGENRSHMIRNSVIIRCVEWLVAEQGYSEADAIDAVRQAAPRPGGGTLTADYIRDIIKEGDPIQNRRNQIDGFHSG